MESSEIARVYGLVGPYDFDADYLLERDAELWRLSREGEPELTLTPRYVGQYLLR